MKELTKTKLAVLTEMLKKYIENFGEDEWSKKERQELINKIKTIKNN